jgi:hypothetical protein
MARVGLAVAGLAAVLAVPLAPPAAAQASPLTKTGTVVETGSTTTAAPGDTINWVVSSTNPTAGPVNATITDPIQGAGSTQTYVPGSLDVPAGFTPEWSTDGGDTWSGTDQGTATNVVRAANPSLESPATAAGAPLPRPVQATATPTGGDGYLPILYTTAAGVPQVWNFFHHTGPAPQAVCTDRLTGLPCAGWSGARYLSTAPVAIGTGTADVITPTPNATVFDPSEPGVIHMGVYKSSSPRSVGNLCINLETQATCGYTPLTTNNAALVQQPGFHATEAVLVGTRVFNYTPWAGEMLCFDTATDAACPGQPYPTELGYGFSITPAINGKIYGTAIVGNTSMRARCFDPATGGACAGWAGGKIVATSNDVIGPNNPRFVTYDASGAPTGVCAGWSLGNSVVGPYGFAFGCFDLAGNPVSAPPNLQLAQPSVYQLGRYEMLEVLQITAPNGHAVSFFPMIQTTFAFGSKTNGGTFCYDWTTSSPCAGFPDDLGIDGFARHDNVNGGNTKDYGYAYDGQCMFGLGDAGWLFTLDPVTGASPCSKTQATIVLDPAAFYCDAKPGHVQSYDAVSLRNIDLSTVNFTTSSVTVRDGDGNVLGTFPFDPVTGEADISSIPAGTSPIKATLDVVLLNGSSFTDTNQPRAVVSFVGDAPQLCFQTVVADDCTASSVSNQATATYTPAGGTTANATSPQVTLTVTGASVSATSTHGSAYGVDVMSLGLHPLNKIGDVATADPGGPAHAARRILTATLPGVVSLGVITTGSDSALAPLPSASTATSEIANVNLLGGLVTASAVKAVSQSAASTESSTYSSAGSGFVNLKINGQTLTNVAPNTTVEVKNPLIPSQVVAAAYLYEETGSRSIAAGQASASHSVNMIRIVLVKPLLGLPAGAEIVVAHAQSDVVAPACGSDVLSVSGEAYTAFVGGNLLGQQVANTKVGAAVLPSQGGADSDGTAVNVNGVATSSTAANTTSGSLTPNPSSQSRAIVEGTNLLDGLITATVLDVASTSSANGMVAATNFAVTFTDLKVGNINVVANPPPNYTLTLPSGGGLVRVVLNEQVRSTNGTTDTEGTVNAIHVTVFGPGGLFTGEIIVASAHSDAHV